MNLKPLVTFAEALEKGATTAGLSVGDIEDLLPDELFVQSCLRAALQRYASGTKNIIVLSSNDTVETLFWKADLTNPSCKHDLPSQHIDRILRFQTIKVSDIDGSRDMTKMLERHKEVMPLNRTALLAFLTHASVNKDFGRDVPTVLLSEFYNGRDTYYTYAIEPHEILGRALVCITTATQVIDYNTTGTTIWSPANMPDPCKVFAVLEP